MLNGEEIRIVRVWRRRSNSYFGHVEELMYDLGSLSGRHFTENHALYPGRQAVEELYRAFESGIILQRVLYGVRLVVCECDASEELPF